jgi:hypothetical protein
LKCL